MKRFIENLFNGALQEPSTSAGSDDWQGWDAWVNLEHINRSRAI